MRRKASKQRDMILDYLMSVDGHLTAEEIYKNMNEQGEQISLATIYRNLGILEELYQIRRIAHPQEGYCYDKTIVPHHHLHCVKCHKLYDIQLPYDARFNEAIAQQTGAVVYSHTIVVEGVCPHCLKEQDVQKETKQWN